MSVQPAPVDHTANRPAADAAVLKAQRQLADLGAYTGAVDGRLGHDTRTAIMRFQRRYRLALSGKPDPQFLEHLQYLHHIHQATTATGSIAPAIDTKSVERAQRQLQKLGYDPGPIDGKAGTKTTEAIRQFQADMRLPADGQLSPALLNRLAPAKTSQVE
ncbi:MAG: peptidoglycan-binding protein [Rhizobiales bacterium]|nr:peptidoglycan-binding protein [Hyphomicrobiales bacterium]